MRKILHVIRKGASTAIKIFWCVVLVGMVYVSAFALLFYITDSFKLLYIN